MDLILLAPGDPAFFENLPGRSGGMLADANATDLAMADFKGCIELVSVQHGLKQSVATELLGSDQISRRPIITELTCVKYLDATSVRFNDYCLRGRPLGVGPSQPTFVHILRNSGERVVNVLKLSLRDAMVSEVQFQSHPDDMPTEQFKLHFSEIIWTYTAQTAEGRPSGTVSAGWSLASNRPIAIFTELRPALKAAKRKPARR